MAVSNFSKALLKFPWNRIICLEQSCQRKPHIDTDSSTRRNCFTALIQLSSTTRGRLSSFVFYSPLPEGYRTRNVCAIIICQQWSYFKQTTIVIIWKFKNVLPKKFCPSQFPYVCFLSMTLLSLLKVFLAHNSHLQTSSNVQSTKSWTGIQLFAVSMWTGILNESFLCLSLLQLHLEF